MATLREVRRRILGIRQTEKITKAMKMVAAAKLRRAQLGVVAARPYAARMRELLQHLTGHVTEGMGPLLTEREIHAVALVVVASDRGLCGAFNSNVFKAAVGHMQAKYPGWNEQGKVKIFCVGKKSADFFSKRRFTVTGKYIGVFNALAFAQAASITRDLVQGFLRGDFDRVEVIFNEFKSLAQQRLVVDRFLPVPGAPTAPGEMPKMVMVDQYIYEPSREQILEAIVPKQLNFQLWRILLESNAAEQGARMAAMENASENASELIASLQLQYNKARQASITKELLEVVGGAEALASAG
jgi:F-type H+-transporting ATPase subunit gamma